MEYLIEPTNFSASGCGQLSSCQCYSGALTCGCESVHIEVPVCPGQVCSCQGGRESCGVGGRVPENSLPPITS